MATEDEYKERLRKVLPWVGSFNSGLTPVHQLADELAAILAEQDARIEALEDVAHTPSEDRRR